MVKRITRVMALTSVLILAACGGQNPTESAETANAHPAVQELSDCDIKFNGVEFSKSLRGAEENVTLTDSVISMSSTEGQDIFSDPNDGKLTKATLPILFIPTDNSKPFTFQAKVTPEFTEDGLYNAADLIVYANSDLWQKLAFEQDEYGNHRIVSVRTDGTSDDNNHDKIEAASVYMKISSDTKTIASYYSLDGKEWHMVRLYKNSYPEKIYLGIASQCPTHGACTSQFEQITLTTDNVGDFRMGE